MNIGLPSMPLKFSGAFLCFFIVLAGMVFAYAPPAVAGGSETAANLMQGRNDNKKGALDVYSAGSDVNNGVGSGAGAQNQSAMHQHDQSALIEESCSLQRGSETYVPCSGE